MRFLSDVFTTALATYLVYYGHQSAANIGFSLNTALSFSREILGLVTFYNFFQVATNRCVAVCFLRMVTCSLFISLERILAYLSIEQEPKPTIEGIPPAYWPANGNLRVEKLSARYSKVKLLPLVQFAHS